MAVPALALAVSLISLPLSAKDDEDPAKERKEQMKDVKKRATAKADKQFRKEAEKLEKQGWKTDCQTTGTPGHDGGRRKR